MKTTKKGVREKKICQCGNPSDVTVQHSKPSAGDCFKKYIDDGRASNVMEFIPQTRPKASVVKKINNMINWIKRLFVKEDFSSKIYCECGHEMLQDPLSDIFEAKDGLTHIECSDCFKKSVWDLDAPVPLFIKSLK